MSEHSNASNVALLRSEARRRKILENSQNRLKLIEGINASCNSTVSPDAASVGKVEMAANDPLITKDVPLEKTPSMVEIRTRVRNAIQENEELKKITADIQMTRGEIEVNESNDEEEIEPIIKEKIAKENSTFFVIEKKRLHYILLAMVVNVLFSFNVGFIFCNNLFCPFYTVKMMELIARKDEKEGMQPFLHLLITSLPEKIQRSAKIIICVLPSLFSDLFLYLFTFIIGIKILNCEV